MARESKSGHPSKGRGGQPAPRQLGTNMFSQGNQGTPDHAGRYFPWPEGAPSDGGGDDDEDRPRRMRMPKSISGKY